PDGTTMMIDAGENNAKAKRHVALKPNDSKSPGEWIVDYINSMANNKNQGLDYMLLTHFHNDHIGGVLKTLNVSGKFYNTGAITVAENIRVGKLVDRGFPDYNYLVDHKDKTIKNYLDFLRYTQRPIKVEQFRPGVDGQFTLLYDTISYKDKFKVQNIYSNGRMWTGNDTITRYLFPLFDSIMDYDIPQENSLSCVLKITYGKFSYYSGGDVTGYPKPGRSQFHDVETQIASIIGKTEVCCVNHHGYNNATNEAFISSLQPQTYVIQASDALHPNHSTLDRMLSKYLNPSSINIFATNLHPAAKTVIGDLTKKMKSTQGHIVIRVFDDGDKYTVYILEDENTKRKIKGIFGPFTFN
ncbi:hypothetical protein JGH11_20025, partial [Dysgonomonas sp. Marseille-P4677]|uniref:ComEC/Rec2 family competence protein n=1 Tax=Dysgonomonas sp. Marseille-P4677 TaxID=2364790 RepID=UPI001A4C7D44